ncbi:MAG: ATP-binding protein [Candidatus Angelobacter sp. Gp1-AA117]|nr:MAG: ATP-binding protein [Candidatus Angelobacter sp. Gp1-AA117]
MTRKKVLLSWSSGKDSAWTLHVLRQQGDCEIAGLITTINSAFDRVAMHSSRRQLVEMQAEAARLPLIAVPLPWPCSNTDYECAMKKVCDEAVAQGVTAIAFGDLFLQDIRAYRERQLQGTGLEPLFPVWQIPTDQLAQEMIRGGLKAKLVCIDPKKLGPEFAGRDFDEQLLRDLPGGIDPCGENGEFHSFVYAGPMFDREIPVIAGERMQRDGFWYADLLPDRAVLAADSR